MGLRVVIAGGGTGGHLFPGIAVARELLARRPGTEVSFAGTARGIEARVLPREGFELDLIRSGGIKGKSIGGRARGADGFAGEAGHVTHRHPSFGLRVTRAFGAGPGLVYSGDCGRAADLEPLIRPGDALLSEVSFGAGPVPPDSQHLDGSAVGDLAARTGAGRVLLTHLQMGFDRDATVASVRARYDGPVELVDPGLRVPLGG